VKVWQRALLAVLLLFSAGIDAHEVRPAYLRIQQVDTDTYEFLWRVPARGQLRLGLYVQMPEHCAYLAEPKAWQTSGIFIERWSAICAGGIIDHDVSILGLSATLTDVLARFERSDGTAQVARLTATDDSFTVSESDSWRDLAATYASLGIEHILSGIDHLLFVLALLIIVSGWTRLVATITAFTLAHSITLGAATLGLVHVPQAPVEAVIALSILFVAIEIVHWRQGREGITRRKPWLVAFIFGLLHGLGFAGALSEIGLPENSVPLALLFFNLGVEAGQLLFVAVVLAGWAVLRRFNWPHWAWRVPVYGIGGMAAFWTIDRISGFYP
jgi:hydrogenase/urease accessory protein HupE